MYVLIDNVLKYISKPTQNYILQIWGVSEHKNFRESDLHSVPNSADFGHPVTSYYIKSFGNIIMFTCNYFTYIRKVILNYYLTIIISENIYLPAPGEMFTSCTLTIFPPRKFSSLNCKTTIKQEQWNIRYELKILVSWKRNKK